MKGNLSDDRERYESERPKPTSRTVATAKGTNRKHWKLGIRYATPKFQSRGKLRTLRQVDFPTVLSWPEKKCFSILKKAGVFGDRRNRRCWVCKAAMVPESQTQAYRCVNRQCSGQRPRLYSWQFSFTPFWRTSQRRSSQGLQSLCLCCVLVFLEVPSGFIMACAGSLTRLH